jgi:predicted branched-subunit amino acid permease
MPFASMPSAPTIDPPQRSATAAFLAGFGAAWLTVMAYVLIGTYIGLAALAHDFGFSLWWLAASTVLVWAGPAQVILVSALGAGAAPVEVAIAVSLSSVRLLPMVISLLPLIKQPQTRNRDLRCPPISPRSACGSRRCASCRHCRASIASRSSMASG